MEEEVFLMLDKLRPTAAGLDGMPAWFLRLGAPVFAAPIAQLFNQMLAERNIPQQWRTAIIPPVPKLNKQAQPSDFRPISITSVLSRIFEKYMYIVRTYTYPALQNPLSNFIMMTNMHLDPASSTTVAIIALFHIVLTMLSRNPFVRVFALNFSKHSTPDGMSH